MRACHVLVCPTAGQAVRFMGWVAWPAILVGLAACGENKIGERAVNDTVRQHVAAQADVCVPERVVYAQSLTSGKLARALQSKGLVVIRNADQATRSGQRTVYEWTPEGQKFLKQVDENGVKVRAVCFATRTLEKVTTQHPPQQGQLNPVWTVQFTQRIDSQVAWSRDATVAAAMPELAQAITQANGLQTVHLQKQGEQWVVAP